MVIIKDYISITKSDGSMEQIARVLVGEKGKVICYDEMQYYSKRI